MLKSYIRKVLKHIVIWTIAFAVFTFLREFGQNIQDNIRERLEPLERIQLQLMAGCIAGLLFGTYAFLLDRFLNRKFSFGRTVLISGLGYLFVIALLILLVFNTITSFFDAGLGTDDLKRFIDEGNHFVIVFYCFLVGFVIEFIQQIDLKFGPGNLWNMLKGKYYHPIEEERVLMFLDMRSSTSIAEKLGHIQYSRLLQDCFKDLGIIANFKGEVYQYVGDEAVLTWDKRNAFDQNKCIQAFFAFKNQLIKRKQYYTENYGLLPEFKAGVNVGMVTTTEVGIIKREIAFHGDTINTAARIQSKCNELGYDFLASQNVINQMDDSASLNIKSVGELELKGKKTKVKIAAIQKIAG